MRFRGMAKMGSVPMVVFWIRQRRAVPLRRFSADGCKLLRLQRARRSNRNDPLHQAGVAAKHRLRNGRDTDMRR